MTSSRANLVIRHLRTVLADPNTDGLTDRQLLERFVRGRDQAAFESLMRRHAALVFGVCERALGHTQDAEDAFQATFMVLARKAGSIRRRRAVGSWLYGVAQRLALRTRVDAARRRQHELRKDVPTPSDPLEEITGRELCRIVDEELRALSERYRAPLLLCYLQAQTQEEAARQLGWSTRTLRRRLERGRELLQARLTKRGLALSTAFLGTLLTTASGSSAALAAVARATRNGVLVGGSNAAAGFSGVSQRAIALANGMSRALFLAKLQTVAAAVLTLGIMAAEAGLGLHALAPLQPAPAEAEAGRGMPVAELLPSDPPARTATPIPTDHYGDPLPSGAQARLGTMRFSIGDWAHDLAFTRDGKTLATGADGCVRMWDVTTGKVVHSLDTPGRRILPIALAPDGKTLAAGSLDGMIYLWKMPGGLAVRAFRGHEQNICGLIFSPDGQTLVSGSTDDTLRVWRVATAEECGRLETGTGGDSRSITWPIAFFPDNRTVATQDMNQRVRLWDVVNRKELPRLDWLPDRLSAVALSPDRTLLAATTEDGPTIHLWQIASGKEIRQWDGHRGQVDALVFSADGSALASAGEDGTIRIWRVATGTEATRMHAGQPRCRAVAFSPDGEVLASALDTTVRLWNTTTGEELSPIREHRSTVLAVTFTGDGRQVLSAGARGTICRWDARTGEPVDICKKPEPTPDLVAAFSPDGRLLGSANPGGMLRVSDVQTGQELCSWQGHKHWIFRLAFAPDGRTLASGGHDKTLALWEPLTGRQVARFTEEQDGVGAACFSPDSKLLAHACSDGTTLVREIGTGEVLHRLRSAPQAVRSLAFSPDGKTLASATASPVSEREPGTICLWELLTGQVRWQTSVSDGRIHCLAFSPDGRTLALGSGDQQIHQWDLSTGKELARLTGHVGAVRCLAYSSDGSLLASGSMDATVLVWKQPKPVHARPAAALPAHELDALWNDLASTDTGQAYRAIWSLAKAPGQAVPLLQARMQEASPDARQGRGEEWRTLRAVEVLEKSATAPARRLLTLLSEQPTPTGKEARAALERLDRRLGMP
jgi:RNA polymerase sigma factor (sigma-70 family)